MKRLISATLALTLLGSTAAVAAPYDYGRYDNRGYHGDYRGHSDNSGAIVAGLGLLAFAAILASQNHDHYQHRYHHGWYGNRYDDRGYGNGGYGDRGYGYGYQGY
jgi:hypothetical protein